MEQTEMILKKLDEHNERDMEQFASMDKRLETIDDKVNQVLTAVVGNEKYGQQGLVRRVKELEDKNEGWKTKYNRALGIFTVLGFLGSLLMGLILTYIQTHFLK